MYGQGHASLTWHSKGWKAYVKAHFCTNAIVDFSLGFETWKILFSPKLRTGTRDAPVLTAILTKPCMSRFPIALRRLLSDIV